jgi:hypothetical protein
MAVAASGRGFVWNTSHYNTTPHPALSTGRGAAWCRRDWAPGGNKKPPEGDDGGGDSENGQLRPRETENRMSVFPGRFHESEHPICETDSGPRPFI